MLRKLILAVGLLCAAWPAGAQQPIKPGNIPTVNSTATIAAGNTFQTVLAAVTGQTPRNSLSIQNNNATDSCWITFGSFGGTTITFGNATKGRSILLLAGGSYTRYYPYVPSDEIEGTCVSTSDTLYIDLQ